MRALVRVPVLLLMVTLACKKEGGATANGGGSPTGATAASASMRGARLLFPGRAADLRLTADRSFATFIANGKRPRLQGVPEHVQVGELYAVSLASAEPAVQLADGVTNEPGGYLYSPDSKRIAVLAGYDSATKSGNLIVRELGNATDEPKRLGTGVTFMTFSPDSRWLAFVEQGQLKLAHVADGVARTLGAQVSTARFSPDSRWLMFRRSHEAAGGLMLSEVAKETEPKKLGDQINDYQFSPDSKRVAFTARNPSAPNVHDLYVTTLADAKPRAVGRATSFFAFSPDSQWLVRTESFKPEKLGDLVVGPSGGGAGRKIGQQVREAVFAPDSKSVAYLEFYDVPNGAGVMGVTSLPDGKPRRVGNRVPNYEWSPEGKFLALNSRFLEPEYSVDLLLYPAGAENSFKVGEGVFAYLYSPGDEFMLFRNACTRETRSCALNRLELARPTEPAKRVFDDAYSFKLSNDASRVLISQARFEPANTYDLAVVDLGTGASKRLAEQVSIPAYFAADDGSKAVFVSVDRARPGVFLATIDANDLKPTQSADQK